jgi:hypothetical protein
MLPVLEPRFYSHSLLSGFGDGMDWVVDVIETTSTNTYRAHSLAIR